jgi:hypothetical protein
MILVTVVPEIPAALLRVCQLHICDFRKTDVFEFKTVELADGVVEFCVHHVNHSLTALPVRNL